MATLRSIVSSIRGMNKLFSADNKITDRLVAAEIRSTAYLLIKQETNKRRLWQSPNLFTALECVDMVTVPLSECCSYSSPCNIARSKSRLPKIAEGSNFGLLVQGVFDVNTQQSYDYMPPSRYENALRLKLRGKQYVYWIKNGYLYINDPLVELASIYAFFEEDIPDSLNTCNTQPSCINPLDKEFKFPGYLEKNLKDIVHDEIRKTYLAHLQDYTPDGKDDAR